MKNFTLLLLPLLLTFINITNQIFATPAHLLNEEESTCTYMLICYSNNETGWQYNSISLFEGKDTLVYEHQLSTYRDTTYFEVKGEKDLSILVTFGSEGDAYQIFDANNNLIYQNGFNYYVYEALYDEVIATTSCTALNYDAELLYADIPAIMNPDTIKPTVYISGMGQNDITFDITMTIGEGYSSTKTVTGLSHGDTVAVVFDKWTATAGEFALSVCLTSENDENSDNNCFNRTITVGEGNINYAYYYVEGEGQLVGFFDDSYESYKTIEPATTHWQTTGPDANGSSSYGFACFLNYGSNNILAGGFSDIPTLWELQLNTGTFNFHKYLAQYEGDDYMPSGLAYDRVNDKIYMTVYGDRAYYEIDKETGKSTLLGDLSISTTWGFTWAPDGEFYTINPKEDNGTSTLRKVDVISGTDYTVYCFEEQLEGQQTLLWDYTNNKLLIFAHVYGNSQTTLFTYDPATNTMTNKGDINGINVYALTSMASSGEFENNTSKDIYVSGFSQIIESAEDLGEQEISIYIKNGGNENISSPFKVAFELIDDNNSTQLIEETVDTIIAPGASIAYTFETKANFSSWGATYSIKSYTELEGDEKLYNDTVKITDIENITPCIIEYPEGAVYENETCGEATNDGCDGDTQNPSYDTILNNETIYGTAWKTNNWDKDHDWYKFEITEAQEISIIAKASFGYSFSLVKYNNSICNITTLAEKNIDKCVADTISLQLTETGDYAIIIAPSMYSDNFTCEKYNNYTLNFNLDEITSPCTDYLYNDYACSSGGGVTSMYLNDLIWENIECGVDNNSNHDWYYNRNDLITTLSSGDSLGVIAANSMFNYVSAWVDFNDDLMFSSDEKVIDNGYVESSNSLTYLPINYHDSIEIEGEHTMRIRSASFFETIDNACDIVSNDGNMLEITATIGDLAPEPSVTPGSFTKTIKENTDTTDILTITNTGNATMTAYSVNCSFNEDLPVIDDNYEVTLLHGSGEYAHLSGPLGEIYAAVGWPADSIWKYQGLQLSEVEIYTGMVDGINDMKFTLYVWGQGESSKPGEVLYTQDFTPTATGWTTVQLTPPVEIEGSDIWFGCHVSGIGNNDYPLGIDAGPVITNYGNMASTDGTSWNADESVNLLIKGKFAGSLRSPWMYVENNNLKNIPTESSNELTVHFFGATQGTYTGTIIVKCAEAQTDSIGIPVKLTINKNTTGNETYTNGELKVYPNPNNGLFQISTTLANSPADISVYDITGRIVYNDKNVTIINNYSIDIRNKKEGVYLLNISNSEGTIAKKIILQK